MPIKYETSIEEAKQIKELGFDFSGVCEKFASDDNCYAYKKYINNTVYYVLTQFKEEQGVHVRMTDWCEILDNSYIPIIPYPILEAYLADNEDFYWGKWQTNNNCHYVLQSKHCEDDNWTFQSVYEAFIWLVRCGITSKKQNNNLIK